MNEIISQFESIGWKFSVSNGIIWFKSPRMNGEYGLHCTLEEVTAHLIEEKEIDCVVTEWEDKMLVSIDKRVIQDLGNQYKLLMKRGMEPPEKQTITVEVTFP